MRSIRGEEFAMECRLYVHISTFVASLATIFLIYRVAEVDLWGDGVGPWLWFFLAGAISSGAAVVASRLVKVKD